MQLFHLTKSAVSQIAKTVQWFENCWKQRHAGTWLSRLPFREKKIDAGTSSWPSWISHFTGSFVGHSPSEMLCPPAKLEVLHLYRWFTHTHIHLITQLSAFPSNPRAATGLPQRMRSFNVVFCCLHLRIQDDNLNTLSI